METNRLPRVSKLLHRIAQTAQLMVGLPDYNAYVTHRRQIHPGEPVMTYEEFFRERQTSRYGNDGGKIGRCC